MPQSIHRLIRFGKRVVTKGNDETTELSEIVARAKLIYPMALEWRNWQTQQTQNLPPVTRHGGSTPPSSTNLSPVESGRYNLLFSRVPCMLSVASSLAHVLRISASSCSCLEQTHGA